MTATAITTTTTAQTKRDAMLQRVLNLRARAEDAGSSEAEMNTALTMAMKLMDAYNIEEAELALAQADGRIVLEVVRKKADVSLLKGKKKAHKLINTLTAIAKFTETKVIVDQYRGTIEYTGHRPDTELANYLTAVIREALDREYENYQRKAVAVGYGAKNAFQVAMSYRISARLLSMATNRNIQRAEERAKAQQLKIENAATASSTALVVSEIAEQKAREVNAAFSKAYPTLSKVKVSNRTSNGTAHGAGYAAGDRVHLGHAVGGSTGQRRIS
jgi:hypothetical protein